jgi:hypothetical protein
MQEKLLKQDDLVRAVSFFSINKSLRNGRDLLGLITLGVVQII